GAKNGCKNRLDQKHQSNQAGLVVGHGVARLYEFPSQWNQNEVFSLEMVRTTAHKYKLSFYTKTEVEVLPIETFAFNPFKFRPFAELEANALMDGNLLFDYIGEVVGKEEAMGMITCTGKESKRIALELEDLK
ncbi:hypothetical protein S83_058365, partial [Arachis hypogaea]